MRGHDRPQATMLTLVNPEQWIPANHPIRLIKGLAWPRWRSRNSRRCSSRCTAKWVGLRSRRSGC
jgi:hypothetical protein